MSEELAALASTLQAVVGTFLLEAKPERGSTGQVVARRRAGDWSAAS